jgi:hypothetical protein
MTDNRILSWALAGVILLAAFVGGIWYERLNLRHNLDVLMQSDDPAHVMMALYIRHAQDGGPR